MILEIWEVQYLANSSFSHFVYLLNDGSNISDKEFIVIFSNTLISISKTYFLPTQFIESSKFDARKVEMFANSGLGQPYEQIAKAISKKRKFSEIWGLERKIIVDIVKDNNDDIYYEVFDVDKLNDSTMDIQNPIN
ncbi:hypothetical protein C2G38_2153422 [Gigaspora rosea]|uniref:Uncharacterized protein n=1 Tax=Gigaspora rosea TaxID=44941 RepID=A0A397WBI5_9GLOM|nr:hypothetical protein C2G38_2153422 [Gigaspora rosea]